MVPVSIQFLVISSCKAIPKVCANLQIACCQLYDVAQIVSGIDSNFSWTFTNMSCVPCKRGQSSMGSSFSNWYGHVRMAFKTPSNGTIWRCVINWEASWDAHGKIPIHPFISLLHARRDCTVQTRQYSGLTTYLFNIFRSASRRTESFGLIQANRAEIHISAFHSTFSICPNAISLTIAASTRGFMCLESPMDQCPEHTLTFREVAIF